MTQPTPETTPETHAPRHVTVAGIHWENVLEFMHLFQGFRLAINPAKILVALVAIVALYAAGRTFDLAWGPQASPADLDDYQRFGAQGAKALHARWLENRTDAIKGMLDSAVLYDSAAASLQDRQWYSEHPAAAYRHLRSLYVAHFQKEVARATAERRDLEKRAKDNETSFQALGLNTQSPAETEHLARRRAASNLARQLDEAQAVVGLGLFDAFLKYELKQFDALLDNTLSLVRISPLRTGPTDLITSDAQALSSSLFAKNPDRFWRSDTILGCLANMTITGPGWLVAGAGPMQQRTTGETWGAWTTTMAYRGLYLLSLLLFAAFSLAVLAFSGAIICRLSALEFAGRERTPLTQAVAFARSHFWRFVLTPLMPFLILAVLATGMGLLGLVGAIPFVGELALGALFLLFLALGFVMMLLLLGTLGGFNLLYPALATEASDPFDALSRALAYVFTRPCRLLTYSLLSLLYGTLTFLFVAFAVYLILALTHTCTAWGTNALGYMDGWYSGLPKLDTLWPSPEAHHLVPPANWGAMNGSEYLGALFLHFWVFLLIGTLAAYALSFYYSAHTIIYFLLRRSVDGQSLSDVAADEPAPSAPPQPPETPAPTV